MAELPLGTFHVLVNNGSNSHLSGSLNTKTSLYKGVTVKIDWDRDRSIIRWSYPNPNSSVTNVFYRGQYTPGTPPAPYDKGSFLGGWVTNPADSGPELPDEPWSATASGSGEDEEEIPKYAQA
jgi:hypothetical protein